MMQVEQQARSAIEEGVFARLEMSLTPRHFGNTGKQLEEIYVMHAKKTKTSPGRSTPSQAGRNGQSNSFPYLKALACGRSDPT